jgi:asparagine synthase (glutamine-hydrolysing)
LSAIAGIYFLDGRNVEADLLLQMTDRLAHRGSDDVGIWWRQSIGLSQRMLWTTSESRFEKLPLTMRDGMLVLTADARIDNRQDLIQFLNISGDENRQITDSELILDAYIKWGEACTQHLVGDFAFVVWDAQNRKLFCARDPMGVKPFYYFFSKKLFAFASEIKALFCVPEIPRVLNEVHIGEQLAWLSSADTTYFQDIFRLPAAHSLSLSNEGIKLNRYWLFESIRGVKFKKEDEYFEAFRHILSKAVYCRLRSDFPVGSSLSGGLDSSSIACIARNHFREAGSVPLHTFSAIFPDLPEEDLPIIDERRFIQAVLDQGGFSPLWIEADKLSPFTGVAGLLWEDDEPIVAPNLYLHAAMFKTAQDQGIRIFLDGTDGDTAISYGYQYLAELSSKGRWIKLIKESSAIAQHYPDSPAVTRKIIWKHGIRPLVPELFVKIGRSMRKKEAPSWDLGKAINPDFARRIRLQERISRVEEYRWQGAMDQHWKMINQALYPYVLEISDKATSRFSIEGRYPFFDRRLLDFAVGLPARFKLRDGWSRYILRKSMEGILPGEVQWRFQKSNLSPNFQRRLIDSNQIELDRVINDENEVLQPFLDLNSLKEIYRVYRHHPLQSPNEALIIFQAYVLARWLNHLGEKTH